MTPTPEQSDILDHEAQKDAPNLMVNALAGTGKSATLKLIDRHSRIKPSLYLVFNKMLFLYFHELLMLLL